MVAPHRIAICFQRDAGVSELHEHEVQQEASEPAVAVLERMDVLENKVERNRVFEGRLARVPCDKVLQKGLRHAGRGWVCCGAHNVALVPSEFARLAIREMGGDDRMKLAYEVDIQRAIRLDCAYHRVECTGGVRHLGAIPLRLAGDGAPSLRTSATSPAESVFPSIAVVEWTKSTLTASKMLFWAVGSKPCSARKARERSMSRILFSSNDAWGISSKRASRRCWSL